MDPNRKAIYTLQPDKNPGMGFWTPEMKDLSSKLFEPTLTRVVSWNFTNYNSSNSELKGHSWCQVRSFQNIDTDFSQKFIIPTADKSEEKSSAAIPNNKEPQPNSSRRIELFPDEEQKDYFYKAFYAARWTYNQTIAAMKTEKLTIEELRCRFVYTSAIQDKPWLHSTAQSIRDGAVQEALKAIEIGVTTQEKTGNPYDMQFKSRKEASDSILYPLLWTQRRVLSAEPIPSQLGYDCRLQKTHLNEFYLIIPSVEPLVCENQTDRRRVIALDPGFRTFMTGYDPEGRLLEWGKSDMCRISRLEHFIGELETKIAKEVGRRKRRMIKAKTRMYERIKNLIHDCHCKLAHSLCKEYEVILLPEFETSRLAQKKEQIIGDDATHSLQTWSHFNFRERLLHKSILMRSRVITVPEDFTTQTCSRCGLLNEVGNKKTFECIGCKLVAGRDFNAAKNILLRACCEGYWTFC